jgi:hypothetical protein
MPCLMPMDPEKAELDAMKRKSYSMSLSDSLGSVVGINNDLWVVFVDDPSWIVYSLHSKNPPNDGHFSWPELD